MKPAGGLKLALQTPARDDRRARFAAVGIRPVGARGEVALVTDSRGRLRYRLPPGDYKIRAAEAGETDFRVRSNGWTTVRLRLR